MTMHMLGMWAVEVYVYYIVRLLISIIHHDNGWVGQMKFRGAPRGNIF